MTSQIRMMLWIGLGVLLWLNVQVWLKDYAPVVKERPAAQTEDPTAPAANSQAGLSAELPTVTGEAAPPATPAPAVPASPSDQAAQAGMA